MPKILVWRRAGKIGRRQYSSLAQSVERMTVNHDVAGSSPAGGARKKQVARLAFFNEAAADAADEGMKSLTLMKIF